MVRKNSFIKWDYFFPHRKVSCRTIRVHTYGFSFTSNFIHIFSFLEVIIAVPFPYLEKAKVAFENSGVHIAAQNCHFENSGAFTGEVR